MNVGDTVYFELGAGNVVAARVLKLSEFFVCVEGDDFFAHVGNRKNYHASRLSALLSAAVGACEQRRMVLNELATSEHEAARLNAVIQRLESEIARE